MAPNRSIAVLSLGLALGSSLAGCRTGKARESNPRATSGSAPAAADSLVVAAATSPVAWLGCQLSDKPCRALALIPPGASAHTWEPRPSDLQALGKASLYLRTGLSFEDGWTPRLSATFPSLAVLDLRGGLSLAEPSEKGHGEEADPHVWSSPRAFLQMADTLAVRWVAARPADSAIVRVRVPALRARLAGLDSLARTQLAPFTGRTFLVNHPGLGYLARDYGLVELPLESHGQEPTPVTLFDVRRIARAQGIKAVFVQPEASRRSAEQIATQLGVPIVEIDLLAPGPYDSVFRSALGRLAGSL